MALLISITVYWFYNQLQRKKVLNLADVLQSSLKGLTQSAEAKQINISVETNDQIFVLADPDMVQTIVRNIFKNKGIITIDSEKDKGTTVSFTLPTTQAPTSDTNL